MSWFFDFHTTDSITGGHKAHWPEIPKAFYRLINDRAVTRKKNSL